MTHLAPPPTWDTNDEPPFDPTLDDPDAPTPDAGHASHTDELRSALVTTAQLKTLTPPPALVDNVLYLDSLAVLYGPSGIGKSFLAADWALHIAHAAWWQHQAVHPGPVLYIAAEGATGIGVRVTAWETHHNLHQAAHPIWWLPRAVNLHSYEWAAALAELAADLNPVLIVIDTYARCIVGADENSARDTGIIVHNLDTIRTAAASCVLVVHHSGKDLAAGSRGSSALRGALDTELELTGDPNTLLLKNAKQKNAEEARPYHLALRHVPGTTSVAIDRRTNLTDDMPGAIADMLEALTEIDTPAGHSPKTWMECQPDVPRRTFFRRLKQLVEADLVANVGTEKQPRYRPADLLHEKAPNGPGIGDE